MINDTTPNFALPLPHPQNNMAEDCPRIRKSLGMLDALLKAEQDANAASALETAKLAKNIDEVAKSARSDISAVQAAVKTAQDEQERIRQELERRAKAVEYIYVGGSGAGDNLIDGRGLVPELPFETLNMALYYSNGKDLARYRYYCVQGDIEEPSLTSGFNNSFVLNLVRGNNLSENPRILLKNPISLSHGFVNMSRVDLEASENVDPIRVYENGYLRITNCSLKGAHTVMSASEGGIISASNISCGLTSGSTCLYCSNLSRIILSGSITLNGNVSTGGITITRGSEVLLASPNMTFSGNLVGKKYHLVQNSSLMLNGNAESNLLGTLAGVCDTSSAVIA